MNLKHILKGLVGCAVVGSIVVLPIAAGAQRDYDRDRDRDSDRRYHHRSRHDTKNEWRNIAIGAGAIGVLGALSGDKTLTFAGAAGALYSLSRYESDRRSERREDRLRSEYFSRPYFVRNGHRYDRQTVTRNGQQYYRFHRSD